MKSIKINQTSINIPTYKWGKEDIEPPLIREFTPRSQPIYPYTTQEIISEKKSDCQYKAIILENEYLRLTFLPELNGRLYSAFDKVNKKELFYKNKVIKPALFGLRGAWAAVGVEYNFPNSHSTTTLEPINWKIKKYEDGSASFITGNIEWVSRMGWSMEVKLRPESCLIEMESKLYNFTDFPQKFYYWLNAAVPAYPETQFIYPSSTKRLYAHPPMDISRLAYIDYPIHHGRDISLFKNIPQHFPIFAENMEEDFFGLYHHNLGTGLVHIADHSLVRGRKIWMFGNARDGRMFVDLLADSNIDYCELQTGPFTLQSDYRMLAPRKIHLQKDTWYPIAGLKGFNAASKELAANIKVEGKKIKVLINSTEKLEHLNVRIRTNQCIKAEKEISVTPLELKSVVFNLPREIKKEELEINFLDETDNEILCYQGEQSKKLNKNKEINIESDSKSSDSMCLKGHYAEEQCYPQKAMEIYCQAAKTSLKAKVSKARLIAVSGRFKDALEELEKILAVDRENEEATYLSGICLENLGEYKKAEKRFSYLGDNEDWMEKALLHLAKISIMQKKYTEALSRLKQFAELYPVNSYALSLYALSLRKTSRIEEAEIVLNKAGEVFSFDPLVWGESFLLKKFQKKADAFKTISTRTSQQIIEIFCRYMAINEFEEGLGIVNAYMEKRENASIIPLVFYYRGYIEESLGKKKESKRSFAAGRSSKAKWDFVFRLESEAVLKAAIESNPDDYQALYYLGNLLAFKNRWNEAVFCWEKVRGNNLSCALRAQGLFYWKIKNEYKKAIKKYKEAVSVKHCGVKTIWEYDHVLEEKGYSEERIRSLRGNDKIVQKDPRLLLRLASTLIALDYCEEALKILKANKFPLCEGKILPRLLYEEACCKLGDKYIKKGDTKRALTYYQMPLEYTENLGVGKPSRNMEAEWWYRAGELLKKTGNIKKSKKFFRNGAEKGDGIEIEFFPLRNIIWEHEPDIIDIHYWINEVFRVLCLEEIGEATRKKEILREIESFVDSKIAEGRSNESGVQLIKALAIYGKGEKGKAVELLNHLVCKSIPYSRMKSFTYVPSQHK
ncbi:DUF5107 domain-containing protein [bacterium]|nr:DUF5107 domain-containing protein [bacterium]